MKFDDALSAAAKGDVETARQFFRPRDQASTTIVLKNQETVTFHYDDVLPWTSLRREFELFFQGVSLVSCQKSIAVPMVKWGLGGGLRMRTATGHPRGLKHCSRS
jgi:hypothetical protein